MGIGEIEFRSALVFRDRRMVPGLFRDRAWGLAWAFRRGAPKQRRRSAARQTLIFADDLELSVRVSAFGGKFDKMQVRGEMNNREHNMFGYLLTMLGALITVGCTLIAVVTLAEKLMSQ